MNIALHIIWKNFTTAIGFIIAVLCQKIDYIFFLKSSFSLARYMINEHCKSVGLIVIKKMDIPSIIINAFSQSQN